MSKPWAFISVEKGTNGRMKQTRAPDPDPKRAAQQEKNKKLKKEWSERDKLKKAALKDAQRPRLGAGSPPTADLSALSRRACKRQRCSTDPNPDALSQNGPAVFDNGGDSGCNLGGHGSNPEESSLSKPHSPRSDYVSRVRGHELSPDTPAITWMDGTRTVVPFIPSNRGNALAADEDAVRRFSKFPDSRKSPYIVHLSGTNPPSVLVAQSRLHLSMGHTVVIDNAEKVEPLEFDMNWIADERRIELTRKVCVHDAFRRNGNVEDPHSEQTMRSFFDMVPNHSQIGCILDLPSAAPDHVPLITKLDDGLPAYQNMEDLFSRDHFMFKDTQNARNWELLHTGGFHTFEHHDAEGYATFLRIITGCKMWGIARPAGYAGANTRNALDEMNKLFIRTGEVEGSWRLKWEENGGEIYTITAEPGSLVIMPPGTWHLVYTPVRTLAVGGHLYMFETLHLTEVSRWFDRNHAREVTNTSHMSSFMTLCMMMCNLARKKRREFRCKPVQALCRMVIHWRKYLIKGEDPEIIQSINDMANDQRSCQLAQIIAKHIVAHFKFDLTVGAENDYLFAGEWLDAGPIIDLEPALVAFNGTDIRPNIDGSSAVSMEEIIKGEWTPSGGKNKKQKGKEAGKKRKKRN
ncbi:hypothetical protein BD779DRAFT_1679446 [Infundibulicybe gibba]|nr:hypothetical protein BD779DRAFT_1680645 [Infundibulicybe gibba]KAF8873042.1 hypothetical protein BD779DRAFT_1679446 [Infundibulicybe gibba]